MFGFAVEVLSTICVVAEVGSARMFLLTFCESGMEDLLRDLLG